MKGSSNATNHCDVSWFEECVSFYAVFGMERSTFCPDKLQKEYRRLCRANHPDKTRPDQQEQATHIMAIVNEAYQALKDVGKRLEYDQKNEKEHGEEATMESSMSELRDKLREMTEREKSAKKESGCSRSWKEMEEAMCAEAVRLDKEVAAAKQARRKAKDVNQSFFFFFF
jgi:DnaJ-class molecular chaperone